MNPAELPDDIDTLKALVVKEHGQFVQERERAEQEHQRAELFKYRWEKMARRYFGASSEKSHEPSGQQLLFSLPQPEPQAAPPETQAQDRQAAKRHGGGRRKLPPDLIRQRIEYTLPEHERRCPCCGEVMQPFGEELSEQLEFRPASLFVMEHAKIKYACAEKCAEKPLTAPGPEKVVDKGLAGPGLMAWNVVSKFGDHQPNYRQEGIFERHGLEIARSTQCGWQATVADLLKPLYQRMIELTLHSDKLQTDDTPVRVLAPGRGKTRQARFWVYCGDEAHPFTVFDYTPSRSRDGPEKFLKGFEGYLQADAYTGYNRILAGSRIQEVACMAHARRYFFDAQDTDARAGQMLELVRELYRIEDLARPMIEAARKQPWTKRAAALTSAYALRLQVRQTYSVPVLAHMKAWLDARVLDTLPKSPLGEALTYALNQWEALVRFTENGALEIDNNIAENALRPIALGRKNYLFMGSDEGGRRAAILYSLVRSCERHGLNAWDYLRDVLTRMSSHPASRIDELLPHLWKPVTQPSAPTP